MSKKISTVFESINSKDIINTTFEDDNLQNGNYFLVEIKNKVKIKSIRMNIYAAGHASGYYQKLSINGPSDFPAPVANTTGPSEGTWTKFFGPQQVQNQVGDSTEITFSPFSLEKGYYAFIIANTNRVNYTNGTQVNKEYVSNDDISIYEGYGVKLNFSANLPETVTKIYSPRVVNIEITYDPVASSTPWYVFVAYGLWFYFIIYKNSKNKNIEIEKK